MRLRHPPRSHQDAPLILELQAAPELQPIVAVTAQHHSMLDQVLEAFSIVPDHDLGIGRQGRTLTDITCRTLEGLDRVLQDTAPETPSSIPWPGWWLQPEPSLVITDSGGIQEEAPSLGKPVLVLLDVTERPEAVAAGAAELIGTDPDHVAARIEALIHDPVLYGRHGPRPVAPTATHGPRSAPWPASGPC